MVSPKENRIFLVLLTISLILLSVNSPGKKNLLRIKQGVFAVYQGLFRQVEAVGYGVGRFVQSHKIHRSTFLENQRLQEDLLRLRQENLTLRNRFHDLLPGETISYSGRVVVGRILSWDLMSPYTSLVINRGTRHGIRENAPVIDNEGSLVGKISYPLTQDSASVLLISNPEFGVGVSIGQDNTLGILRGMGKESAEIRYIRLTQHLLPGEPVFTSGLDGTFPEGINIGTITYVSRGYYDLSARVSLRFYQKTNRTLGVILP